MPTRDEIAACLDAAPEDDLYVLELEPMAYGCGELLDPPRVWVLTEDQSGTRSSCCIAAARVKALELAAGGTCQRADLHDLNEGRAG